MIDSLAIVLLKCPIPWPNTYAHYHRYFLYRWPALSLSIAHCTILIMPWQVLLLAWRYSYPVDKIYLKPFPWLLLFRLCSCCLRMTCTCALGEFEKSGVLNQVGEWGLLTFDFSSISSCKFCDELPCFTKLRWITHLQISHRERWNVYLSKDTNFEVHLCCMLLWTLH
jgi:hypothetical protein